MGVKPTEFSGVRIPERENGMSRRYLRLLEAWLRAAMQYFEEWPGRPDCGHFFGGVLWYGQETAMPMAVLAAAAGSPEFDAAAAGLSADETRAVALKCLRYLCFTHDTGPADCVRPRKSWGRTEPAGTKWGERGRGFFPESQCGSTIALLALTAAHLRDAIGPEEREMLAAIAADYLERFGDMAPRSGVYYDTQMEENAWTAYGLSACLSLLEGGERREEWERQAELWMFRASTAPQDQFDNSPFADGKTVRELCGRTYTVLPDGTAENHGFVHPSYMASSIVMAGSTANVLEVFGRCVPPHLFWRRADTYAILSAWCDGLGAPHCVQGMDWPYFYYVVHCLLHATASVHMGRPEAARHERDALAVVEQSMAAHGGRLVPEETARFCHGQQDPAIMRERMAVYLAHAYLAHRLRGEGAEPADQEKLDGPLVHVYPHGGALLHRHAKGLTSIAWRNRTMVLPATREGMKLIGPRSGSFLADLEVEGRAESVHQVALKIREEHDRAAVLLVQQLHERSVRRSVFWASLPSGKCLVWEILHALAPIRVRRVAQGVLGVVNDGYFGDREDGRSVRTLYWPGGEREFRGFAADNDGQDEVVALGQQAGWVNIGNRCGLVFSGSGRAQYHNRHHWGERGWHAIEDLLTLSLGDEPARHEAGDTIAQLLALWCPEQAHTDTAATALAPDLWTEARLEVQVDGVACMCDFDALELSLQDPCHT